MGKQAMYFNDEREPKNHFLNVEKMIRDRGSVYSVSLGRVRSREELKNFLRRTKSLKHHDRATHHSWAVRIARDGVLYESKSDDGETGAGNVILRILQKKRMVNTAVCVTRWYGGVKLEADRFKHVQDATVFIIEEDQEGGKSGEGRKK